MRVPGLLLWKTRKDTTPSNLFLNVWKIELEKDIFNWNKGFRIYKYNG